MENISRALKNIVKEFDTPEMLQAAAPAAWNRGVGDELSRHTAFVRLHNKRLFIAVTDQMWKKQLTKMSERLVYLVNRELGNGSVNFIEFIVNARLVEIEGAKDRSFEIADTDPEQRSRSQITPELENAAAAIENKDLRKLFLGAASISLLRMKDRGKS